MTQTFQQRFQQRIEEVLWNYWTPTSKYTEPAAKALTQLFADEMKGIAEEVAEEIETLRQQVISRQGPNDTEFTRLAELSLFVEIQKIIRSRYLI